MSNKTEIVLTAAQLGQLINAMINDSSSVGELDDAAQMEAFISDLIKAVADCDPMLLLDASLAETLAAFRAGQSLFCNDAFSEAAAELVADYCGGRFEKGGSIPETEMTGMVFTIKANDCLPDEDNVLSSGAWSFAAKEKNTFSPSLEMLKERVDAVFSP